MKSVGEVMAIGRTFKESRGADEGPRLGSSSTADLAAREQSGCPIRCACAAGWRPPTGSGSSPSSRRSARAWTVEEVARTTHIDPWFLREIRTVVDLETELACWDSGLGARPHSCEAKPKASGLGPAGWPPCSVAAPRPRSPRALARRGVRPVYKRVDTCAAEFPAHSPLPLLHLREPRTRAMWARRPKVMILGSGPNRIGQGIEFDYCCVHAAYALRRPATRPSWSTATRRRSRPTTTPPTGSISSR